MKKRYPPQELALLLLYLGLGVGSALLWHYLMTSGLKYVDLLKQFQVPLNADAFLDTWHDKMLAGQAAAPNQYRVLTPWLVQYLVQPLHLTGTIYGAYAVLRGLFVALTLWCFDRYLRTWFSRSAAAAGALCLAAVIPFTYFAVIQESDPLNLLVIVLGFLAIARKHDAWLFPLMLVGTLNRETTLLLPAVYFLARWKEEASGKVILRTVLLAACWAVVFAGLRLRYGHHANYTEQIMWGQNVASALPTLRAFIFLGVLWILPWLAPKDTPVLLRRTLWLVPPFVALHYIVAVVQEVRLFLPLAPILIPLSWWVLFPEARTEAKAPAPARAGARRGT